MGGGSKVTIFLDGKVRLGKDGIVRLASGTTCLER
jgi:hypothetical protein